MPLELDKLPTQHAFMTDWHIPFRAYGGGFANGKTSAGCYLAVMLSYLIPGNRGFIGRYDGKELRQSTMAEFKRICPPQMIEKQNDQMGVIKFKPQYGGSEIYYGDMKEAMVGPNLGWFYIDQAEEVEEEKYKMLLGRHRKKTPWPLADGSLAKWPGGEIIYAPTYGLVTFNPEGRNWIWKSYHPDSPHCRPDHKLYMASTYDGLAAHFVTQQYVDNLLRAYSPEARKRYLEGSWDVFEGRVYPMFEEAIHVLPRIDRRPHWIVYESIDHGLRNPTAVQWWAVDEFGNLFLLDEHYEPEKPVAYHAQIIKSKRQQLGCPIAVTYLDSACFALTQSKGPYMFSIADEYIANGIFPVRGQKDWDAAASRIQQHLAVDPAHYHPLSGELGAPRLYVAAHCQAFIREMLGYTWKKQRGTLNRNEPDEPIDHNDHHMDALAYFIISRPAQPVIEASETKDALQLWREHRARYNPLAQEPASHGSWMSV